MTRMLVGNDLANFGSLAITPERSVPLATPDYASGGFFRGIAFGFAVVVPVWTGLIWLGLRLFNIG